jgi:hypothetical protein
MYRADTHPAPPQKVTLHQPGWQNLTSTGVPRASVVIFGDDADGATRTFTPPVVTAA